MSESEVIFYRCLQSLGLPGFGWSPAKCKLPSCCCQQCSQFSCFFCKSLWCHHWWLLRWCISLWGGRFHRYCTKSARTSLWRCFARWLVSVSNIWHVSILKYGLFNLFFQIRWSISGQETWPHHALGQAVVEPWLLFGWIWIRARIWRKIRFKLMLVLVGVLAMVVSIILTVVCLLCRFESDNAMDFVFIILDRLKLVTLLIAQHQPIKWRQLPRCRFQTTAALQQQVSSGQISIRSYEPLWLSWVTIS